MWSSNKYLIRIPKGEVEENGAEAMLNEIMFENFPEQIKKDVNYLYSKISIIPKQYTLQKKNPHV